MAQHRGGEDHQERNEADHVGQPQGLVPAVDRADAVEQLGHWISDETPLLEARVALRRDPERLGEESGDCDHEEHAEDHRVFGPGLDTDAVGAPLLGAVSAHDRPDDSDQEDEPGAVAHRCVGPVDVAVKKLCALGELVVDLEDRGDTEQYQEAEVDHRVHDPGARLAQQCLHVDPGPEVGQTAGRVLRCGPSVFGTTAFPVLDPVGEHHRPVNQQHRYQCVEGELQHARDVDEHLAAHRTGVVLFVEHRNDSRCSSERGYAEAEANDVVMGLQS